MEERSYTHPGNTVLLTPDKWEQLLRRQEVLEDAAKALGVVRYNKALEDAQERNEGAMAGATRKLLRDLLEPMERSIQAMLDEYEGKRGGRPEAVRWVQALHTVRHPKTGQLVPYLQAPEGELVESGVPVAAFITLRTILDRIHEETSLHTLSKLIARRILDEVKYRRFRALAPGLFEYRMKKFDTSSYAHRARSLSATMKRAGCEACRKRGWQPTKERPQCKHLTCADLQLRGTQMELLGSQLINVAASVSIRLPNGATSEGIIRVYLKDPEYIKKKGGGVQKKDQYVVSADPVVMEYLDQRNARLEVLTPLALPMVVPPLAWAPGQRGGYRFGMAGRFPFVRKAAKEYLGEIEGANMPLVYEAVNRIQETPWQINRDVLRVVWELAERGGEWAGLPRTKPVDEPMKPTNVPEDSEEFRAWVRAVGKAKDAEAQRRREARGFYRIFAAAEEVADQEAIWFPHNCDWRGRVYPIADALSPQGDDLQKGLLRFAEGKPLGERGAWYLALHGANCLGELPFDPVDGQTKVSKLTLEERVRWIREHSDRIVEVANDPIGVAWWKAVDPHTGQPLLDEPFQFLAFAFEWAGYMKHGDAWVSHLPVAIDGTCNGLQHISALMRSRETAEQVNVVPSDRPQDVYDTVRQVVEAEMEALAEKGDEAARLWMASGLMGRSLVKRPVMTFGYGSEVYGFRDQIREYVEKTAGGQDAAETLFQGKANAAYGLLARLIWDALDTALPGAKEFMKWAQRNARLIAKEDTPVRWTVPHTGFRVVQPYFVQSKQQVRTILCGKLARPVVYEDTSKPESYRQANGISPNIIHSLDAAALQLTVVAAARQQDGMSFAMVHDSYGTHAADAEMLARLTRECFLDLYTAEGDVLENLRGQFQQQTPEEVERLAQGDLDLSDVLLSEFFFC